MKTANALLLLLSAHAMAAVEVKDAQLTAEADIGHLAFSLSGSTTYKVFTLENPSRVVIDLSDAHLAGSLPNVNFRGSPVRSMRSGTRHGRDLRVVLELNGDAALQNYVLQPADKQGYRLLIALKQPGVARTAAREAVVATAPVPSATEQTPSESLAKSMEEGRQAMAKGDYAQAITLYTKILENPPHPYSQDALEYLGLARERNGHLALAKAAYDGYLNLYPQGEGADRVRQRLAGLLTAQAPAQKKLRDEQRPTAPSAWNVYSSFSQYYRHDASAFNGSASVTTQSSLNTNLDVSGQLRRADYELRTRFSGGYRNDFLNDNRKDLLNISSLYVDAATAHRDLAGRIGRQSLTRGGVLGRFDGAYVGYKLNPFIKLNAVSGYPVELIAPDHINTDTVFYGVNLDLGTFANAWDFNTFAIEQTSEGLLDRRAAGGEIRYFQRNYSLFGLADYDVSFNTLNTAMLLGNWTFAENAMLSFVADHRKSPVLTLRNALIGQGTTSLATLLQRFSESEIRTLAVDRTPDSTSYTLGLTYPLNAKLLVAGDVTQATISSTPASGGVEAMPSSKDTSYGVQLMANDIIREGDMNILGVRQDDNSTSDTTSVNLNLRYPVNTAWRLNPWLRIDHRHFKADSSNQWTIAPAFRATYQWGKQFNLEAETGGERSTRNMPGGTADKSKEFYFSLGYRVDF